MESANGLGLKQVLLGGPVLLDGITNKVDKVGV